MWTARGGCGLRVPPNITSVAGVENARTTDRSRYLRNCARGRRPVDCADGTSSTGGAAVFRAPNGMAAMARTPVLPGATPVRALTAQLRHPRPRSATSAIRRLRPFDFSGRRLPPGRADRFQASVRNGRSCAGLPYRLWQLRHGLRAFPGGPVDPDFAQLRPARARVREMSRTKSVLGIDFG